MIGSPSFIIYIPESEMTFLGSSCKDINLQILAVGKEWVKWLRPRIMAGTPKTALQTPGKRTQLTENRRKSVLGVTEKKPKAEIGKKVLVLWESV
jgi:hypothetical protein